jgi:hypothetical protein
MRGSWGRAVGVSVVCATTGCLLTTSLDGLSGGLEVPETGVPSDAASEPEAESGPADSAGGSFCARAAPNTTFCEDFDHGAPGRFDGLVKGGTAIAELDQGLFETAAPSFRVAFPAPPFMDGAKAFLKKVLPRGSAIEVGFAFRVVQAGQGNQLDIVQLNFAEGDGGEPYSLQIQLKDTGSLQLWERIPNGTPHYNIQELAKTLAPGTGWVHLKWTVTIEAGGSAMRLAVEGQDVGTLTLQTQNFQAAPILTLGDDYQAGLTSTWDVRYDDVVAQIK